jgi:hypothetical protein
MGLAGTIRALIALLAGIISLYITEITFGAAMDELYVVFYNLANPLSAVHIVMSPGWQAVAMGTLGNWVWFYRAVIVCIIAIGVWVVENVFMDVDYGRALK